MALQVMEWAGLRLNRPLVMGILNVTPDSFSDGGQHLSPEAAIEAGRRMLAAGADILDIGGESTRPGAAPLPVNSEIDRIVPVIRVLAAEGAVISLDTRNAETMAAGLEAGGRIVNDISALLHDPAALPLVARQGCPVVLMHMRGTPATMNERAIYNDVAEEVATELTAARDAALAAGVKPQNICLDPGIGFAKRGAQNVALLHATARLAGLGHPLLIGLSRKRFLGGISGEAEAMKRDPESLAAAIYAVTQGAHILRVHDVAGTVRALRVWQRLTEREMMDKKPQRRLFGTDGIRGTANTAPMTAEMALKLGQAAGLLFTRGDHRHRVIIGKDTRLSGYMLEPALTAGFISAGMNVTLAGPLPTPAIAMLTRSLRLDLGVVISASHNPYEDNGIKLFGPDGAKLSDDAEAEIEVLMAMDLSARLAPPEKLGRAARLVDAAGRYIEAAKFCLPRGLRLDGLRIVLDCAHGAAYKVAPAALFELGAEVIPLGVSPDGFNINRGAGSTAPGALCEAVLEHHADIGIALDGDADRVILADERGEIIDGDQILGLIARDMAEAGLLRGGGIVATVMSNLGLERFLASLTLTLTRTKVGDRYVAETMRARGFNLGGEQSGHVILSDFATTGDGLVAALQVLSVLVRSGKRASEACRVFDPLPQLLRNVRYHGASPLGLPHIQAAIDAAAVKMQGTGRVLIRASGTEPLIRVMAEGEDQALIEEIVNDLCAEIAQATAQAAE